jgi:hypothetical protein
MVDVNKDSVLTNLEWKSFYGIFIKRFEAIDTDGDYLLDSKEFSLS